MIQLNLDGHQVGSKHVMLNETLNHRDTQHIHESSTIVDLHNHVGMKAAFLNRRMSQYRSSGEFNPVTIRSNPKRLSQGNVDVVLSTIYVPERQLLDDISLFTIAGHGFIRLKKIKWLLRLFSREYRRLFTQSYFDTTIASLELVESAINKKHSTKHNDDERPVKIAKNKTELAQLMGQSDSPVIFVHNVEGAHSLIDDRFHKDTSMADQTTYALENLHKLFDHGVAYLTLAHFYPNLAVTPTYPFPEYVSKNVSDKRRRFLWRDLNQGLTEIGFSIVREMFNIGMLIDISHCTPKARSQIYHLADTEFPGKQSMVMATHVGAYSVNPSPYNLEDWEIQWIQKHRGLVGVIFMNHWLVPYERKFGLDYMSATVRHIAKVADIEVIAIGTDFDGFTDPPDDLVDSSYMVRFTERLLSELTAPSQFRYTVSDIEAILGGNALRVLNAGWGR